LIQTQRLCNEGELLAVREIEPGKLLVIIRYEGQEIIGLTVLHASKR